jgi:hypothetical protein
MCVVGIMFGRKREPVGECDTKGVFFEAKEGAIDV